MKILNYLTSVLFLASAVSFHSYGQGYELIDSESNMYVTDCDSIIHLNVSMEAADSSGGETFQIITQGTNPQTSSLTLEVYWGDGTNTAHMGASAGPGTGIVFTPPLTHTYNSFDDYTVIYQVSNPQNTSFIWDSLYYTYANCDSNNLYDFCLSGTVYCDQDSNGVFSVGDSPIPNALINFTNNGSSWTASANQNGHYSTTYMGTTLGIATTAQIDQTWLYQNGYGFQSSPLTTWADTCGNQSTLNLGVNCSIDTTGPYLYDLCLSGTVYCDQDSNGVFSAGDSPIPNALIDVTYNGSSWSVFANQNGYYSTTYMGPILGIATTAQIRQNWLIQNGYASQSSPMTSAADTCGNQSTLNLGVNCNIDTTGPYLYDLCLSGTVYCDQDSNGVFSAGDSPIPNALIDVTYNGSSWSVFANQNGYYSTTYMGPILGIATTAQIRQNWLIQNGYASQSSPMTASADTCGNQSTLNLGVNCSNAPCSDLFANVTPWIGYYQNYDNTIKISYGNYGPNNPGAYQVSLTFPAGVTPVASSFTNQSYTLSGNTMTWNLTGASAGYTFNDYVEFDVPPGITNGTNHAYTISITPAGSVIECDSSNNYSTLNMIVGQSYDPNDKTVHNQKYLDPMEADVLTYVIRFQNTGTAPAQDVYIIDTMSSNLDLNTFEILETSHNLNVVDLGNGVIKFDYPQIWLPDSNANEATSHGYVIYKIQEKQNNPIGSSIENTAYIYFDWNPAIITNTTININQTNSLNELGTKFSVYPNPFNDQIRIQGTASITGYEFIDAAGKVIFKQSTDSKEVMISTAELTAGLYYLNILSESGNTIQKIVKH